ncbi:MAG: sialidase family protein [Candidatus Zixiibacteriota bacterium]
MRNLKNILLIGISVLIGLSFSIKLKAQNEKKPDEKSKFQLGSYLGQKPPGTTPELFLPNIFLKGTHSAPSFTPDGTEMYWSRYYIPEGSRSRTQHIFYSQFSGNQWTEPMLAPFSGSYSDGGPFLTNNGNRLFFYSNRPAKAGEKPSDEYIADIWFVDKTDDGWGVPQRFQFNTDKHDGMATVADDGTIFFQSNRSGSHGIFDIYYSNLINGVCVEPIRLGSEINCSGINFSPLIAPNQSFLIVSYNHNSPNNGLYISFKKPDGTWTKSINMGGMINLTSVQRFPGLSPDGKYLFFVRAESKDSSQDGMYWIDAIVIDSLKDSVLNR